MKNVLNFIATWSLILVTSNRELEAQLENGVSFYFLLVLLKSQGWKKRLHKSRRKNIFSPWCDLYKIRRNEKLKLNTYWTSVIVPPNREHNHFPPSPSDRIDIKNQKKIGQIFCLSYPKSLLYIRFLTVSIKVLSEILVSEMSEIFGSEYKGMWYRGVPCWGGPDHKQFFKRNQNKRPTEAYSPQGASSTSIWAKYPQPLQKVSYEHVHPHAWVQY